MIIISKGSSYSNSWFIFWIAFCAFCISTFSFGDGFRRSNEQKQGSENRIPGSDNEILYIKIKREKITESLKLRGSQATIKPLFLRGKFDGYQLLDLRGRGAFSLLGLKNRDVLISIDGVPLVDLSKHDKKFDDRDQLKGTFPLPDLVSVDHLELVIRRKLKKIKLIIEIERPRFATLVRGRVLSGSSGRGGGSVECTPKTGEFFLKVL